MSENEAYDIVVVGGGVNGAGIARDAALRGLKVLLCEAFDLASSTSSASTKLVHGGLRYLEHREFKLVSESLQERETLLRIAPHIIQPMRFILPHAAGMRPFFVLRAGMFLYDRLASRDILPKSSVYKLAGRMEGEVLEDSSVKACEYSDCWVDDARLVVLNAVDAKQNGATILPQTRLEDAKPSTSEKGLWEVKLEGKENKISSKLIINAAGPWAAKLRARLLNQAHVPKVATRLIQGSHIIIPRIFDHDKAYILQNTDKRIVFAIPYMRKYTMVGTTDREFRGEPRDVEISTDEIDYLLALVNRYFLTKTSKEDVVWSFSGVRCLFDDGSNDAQQVSRDYILKVDENDAPLVNVFGGKLTTYRKVADNCLQACAQWLPNLPPATTGDKPLPGGDFPFHQASQLCQDLIGACKDMPEEMAWRWVRAYGTLATKVLAGATNLAGLGECFGADLYEAEVNYLVKEEWASCADDILWRRSKTGLALSSEQKDHLEAHLS